MKVMYKIGGSYYECGDDMSLHKISVGDTKISPKTGKKLRFNENSRWELAEKPQKGTRRQKQQTQTALPIVPEHEKRDSQTTKRDRTDSVGKKDYSKMKHKELYEEIKQRKIKGRSKIKTKAQMIEALKRHDKEQGRSSGEDNGKTKPSSAYQRAEANGLAATQALQDARQSFGEQKDYSKMKHKELYEEIKQRKIKGRSKLKTKSQMVEALKRHDKEQGKSSSKEDKEEARSRSEEPSHGENKQTSQREKTDESSRGVKRQESIINYLRVKNQIDRSNVPIVEEYQERADDLYSPTQNTPPSSKDIETLVNDFNDLTNLLTGRSSDSRIMNKVVDSKDHALITQVIQDLAGRINSAGSWSKKQDQKRQEAIINYLRVRPTVKKENSEIASDLNELIQDAVESRDSVSMVKALDYVAKAISGQSIPKPDNPLTKKLSEASSDFILYTQTAISLGNALSNIPMGVQSKNND